MIRFSLLILLIIVGLKTNAQNKFSVSIDASPVLSYRSYTAGSYSPGTVGLLPSGKVIYDYFKHLNDSTESSKYGFQVSVKLGYHIANRLTILTGIQFKNIGVKNETTYPIAYYDVNGQPVQITGSNSVFKQHSNLYYLGIPLGLQLRLCSIKKFTFGLNLGTTLDFLISHKVQELRLNPDSETKEDYSDYSSMPINWNAGMQIDYKINDRFYLFFSPQFTEYFTPNIKINASVSNDLYSKINQYNYFGEVKFGVTYKL